MKSLLETVRSFLHARAHIRTRGRGIHVREAVAYILAFTLGVVIVGVLLRWHIASGYQHELASCQTRVSNIADDRAQRVADWLRERQEDAQVLATHSSVRTLLRADYGAGQILKHSPGSLPELTAVLDEQARLYPYSGIYVLDHNAKLMAQSSRSAPLNPLFSEICRAVIRSGATQIGLVGETSQRSMVGFAVPVLPEPGTANAGRPKGQLQGIVLVVSDASQTLFPLVAREGVPTRTGETVLMRRDGDTIVVFSPLRHVPASSPNLRFPLSTAPVTARLALEGRETFMEYDDYRGIPVLAATRHIPLTDWGLVCKIDRAEAMEDFRGMAMVEAVAGGLLVILLGGLLLFLRRDVMTRVLQREEEKFRALLESAPDAIYIFDPSTLRILRRNRRAAEMDGYSNEDLAQMTAADFHAPEEQKLLREWSEGGPETRGVLHLHTLRRKDGQLVPVEENRTLVDTGGERFVLSIVRDITERKRAEEALTKERHLLHTLMDNLPDMIYFKDRESHFTRINLAHAKMFGLSNPAEAVGKTDFDFFAGEHAPEAYRDEQEIIRTGQPMVDKEEKEIWPDGHVTWASTTKMPLRNPNGDIIGTFGVSRDITKNKLSEEALRESEEKYRSLVSNIPDVVWTVDDKLRFTFISKNIERISGYSLEEVCQGGSNLLLASLHPDDVHEIKEGFRGLITKGQPFDVECRLQRKGGEWIWVHDRAIATYEKDGIRYATGLLSDITERKRAEEHTRLQTAALESAANGIVIANLEGNIIWVNPAFTRLTGYPASEVMGKNPRVLKSGVHDKVFYQDLWDTILSGEVWQGEIVNKRKDGTSYIEEMTITPVRDAQGTISHFIAIKQDITERKRAGEELYQSRQMLQTILDTIPQRVFWKDRNISYLGCNKAFAIEAGLKDPAEIVGKNDYELAWRETAEDYRSDDKLVMEQDTSRLDYEEIQDKPDGSLIWLRTSKLPLHSQEGKVIGVLGTYEDITTRKQMEVKLQEQQNFVAAVLESVQSGIIACNERGAVTLCNPLARESFGVLPEDIPAEEWPQYYDLYLADGKTLMKKEEVPLFRALQGEHVSNMEMMIIPKHGEPRTVLASAQPIIDSKGRNWGAVVALHDITIRKRAEQDLLFKTALLEAQSETTIDGILVVDMSNQVLLVNRQFAKMWGFPEQSICIKADSKVLEQVREQVKTPEAFLEKFQYLYTHNTQESRDEIELKDGRIFDRYTSPLQGSTGKLYGRIWYFRDITERRELERMKSELVSVVSHELRTPLTSIRGALGLLAGGLLRSQPEKGNRMLEIAVSNTDRLVRLINDVLDLERMESGKMNMEKQTCNAADLMTQSLDSVRDLAEKTGVTLSVSPYSARVWVDPDRIIQALINLLSNAIKFSTRGGTIWLSATPQADQLLFQVKDQGRGIPQEMLERIFERFQQVDASDRRDKGGTGLGLPITRRIVQQHDGRIWVESTLGQGSTFSFTLPLLQAETILVGDGSGTRKVLVCTVETDILRAVQAVLNPRGYTILASSTWQEAIEMASSKPLDAILVDWSLPDMEDMETMAAWKQKSPARDIPVIGLGGTAPDEVHLTSMGLAGWVTKPLNEASLLRALGSVLGKPGEGPRVLVVEDDTDLARVLMTIFERHGAVVLHARTGQEAVQVCPQFIPDLLVLDVMLPELDGFAVVEKLRQHKHLQHLPLAVYSVRELDDSEKARLRLGESIFMTKSRLTPQEFEQRAIGLLNWATSGQRERRSQ